MVTVYYNGRMQIKNNHGKRRMGQSVREFQVGSFQLSFLVELWAALSPPRSNAHGNIHGALPTREAHLSLSVWSFYWGLVTEIWFAACVADLPLQHLQIELIACGSRTPTIDSLLA